MEQTNQLQCAKELDENSVAIILTVSGHIFNGNQKMISYIKKSNAKVVIITNDQDFDFGFEPDYVIGIGDPKYKRTGKHNLLTTMELWLYVIILSIIQMLKTILLNRGN